MGQETVSEIDIFELRQQINCLLAYLYERVLRNTKEAIEPTRSARLKAARMAIAQDEADIYNYAVNAIGRFATPELANRMPYIGSKPLCIYMDEAQLNDIIHKAFFTPRLIRQAQYDRAKAAAHKLSKAIDEQPMEFRELLKEAMTDALLSKPSPQESGAIGGRKASLMGYGVDEEEADAMARSGVTRQDLKYAVAQQAKAPEIAKAIEQEKVDRENARAAKLLKIMQASSVDEIKKIEGE